MRTRKILCMTYRPNTEINQEVCEGDCYEYDDVLRIKEDWSKEEIRMTMEHLLRIHAGVCGNSNYRVGVDFDESSGVFIGTLYRFGVLDMVTGRSVQAVVESLAKVAIAYFDSEQYKKDIAKDPGRGRDACHYGDDAALKGWMAKVGGFGMDVFA